jgi:hypothetical protein
MSLNRGTYLATATSVLFCMLLSGCASPPEHPQLVEADLLFAALQSKSESITLVPQETQAAFVPLAQAYILSNRNRSDPRIEELSILAKKRIALAEQRISEKLALGCNGSC